MESYQTDYYEQKRMERLLHNIIRDYEDEESLVEKKNNIRLLAEEFAKEDINRVRQLKANREKVEVSPNMKMLQTVYKLNIIFPRK